MTKRKQEILQKERKGVKIGNWHLKFKRRTTREKRLIMSTGRAPREKKRPQEKKRQRRVSTNRGGRAHHAPEEALSAHSTQCLYFLLSGCPNIGSGGVLMIHNVIEATWNLRLGASSIHVSPSTGMVHVSKAPVQSRASRGA